MIRLDFYKLLPEMHYIGADDEQSVDCSFTPYKVFILETRLYPLIFKMFPNKNLEIFLKSEYNLEKNRMDVFLVIKELENTTDPSIENKMISLSEDETKIITKKIYEINSKNPNYALIDIHELYDSLNIRNTKNKNNFYPSNFNKKMSFSWFRSVLEYTGLDSSFNPFIQEEGIYLTFNPNSDYKTAYYEVSEFLIDKILDFYKRGVVVLGDLIRSEKKENLVKNWDLIPLDLDDKIQRIYEPNWTDYRFARNKVDFMLRKIEEDPYIRIKVSDNLVKRHGIAQELEKRNKKMIFEGSYLKVVAANIEEAYEIASLVTYATATYFGRVLVIAASRLSEIHLYFDYSKIKFKYEGIRYNVFDTLNPYMFSVRIDGTPFENTPFDDLRLEFRNYALNRLIEVSKISKFKNSSPHDLIIQEYSI